MPLLLLAAWLALGPWLAAPAAAAPAGFQPFVVKAIRVEGLQRVEPETLYSYLPVEEGQRLTPRRAAEAIHALFRTGFFSDVRLERDGDTLVVRVKERPSIASVHFEGNKSLRKEDLEKALERIGLAKGRIFDRSLLERVELELRRQYFNQGRYGVRIRTEVRPLPDNRVALDLKIQEGPVARIRRIVFIGNRAFDDRTLLKRMQLRPSGPLSFLTRRDRYAKPKLEADLEALRSFYLDRGYVDFDITGAQVTISPDLRAIHIVIALHEGRPYRVSAVRVAGETVVPAAELRRLVAIAPGELFSRKRVTEAAARIADRLGEEGYAFANVNPVPEVDREARTVALTFYVDPGRRVYVRRVEVAGNARTRDEVIRRELRQLEGSWLSTRKVRRSRERLLRLGYFEEVNVETPRVPGSRDQVDVRYTVKERSSFGTLMVGAGFSQSQGLLLNASVNQENFLGTGKRVTVTINNSSFNTIYNFAYTNPYYTPEGISRGFNLYLRSTDTGSAFTTLASYTSDVAGGSLSYSIPRSEYDTAHLSLGYDRTHVRTGSATPQAYLDFLTANGERFDAYKLTLGWTRDSRNRAFFPDRGFLESLSLSWALPLGLSYAKLSSDTRWYLPLAKRLTLQLRAQLAGGWGYGKTQGFPFFEHYYAGGISSVRGYRSLSLGPQENGVPLGGALRTVAGAELMAAPPFVEDTHSLRLGLFLDAGQVYRSVDAFDPGELRLGAGLSLRWLSPVGPLTFSVARALNARASDDTQAFQFALGAPF
ncbi:MAG: outer membrane protein assembly factor BamA [Gammaproteobacteria bacterium]|nr:MAG: outer membrane protein assembly factor BamA [Gammaproteobacteria bacterium]